MELATLLEKPHSSLQPNEVLLRAQIKQGFDEIDNGEVYSHEEVMAMLEKRLIDAKAKKK